MGYVLTPMFYLVLTFLWVGLPLLQILFSKSALLSEMPVPSTQFMIFFVLHAGIFILIDVKFFNVGQVFEMFIAIAAVGVALDMNMWLSARTQDKTDDKNKGLD